MDGENIIKDWTRLRLTTICQACPAIKAERLEQVIDWVVEKLRGEQWSVPQINEALEVP